MPPAGYRATHETEIKKSRFIADFARTDSSEQAREFIASIKSVYPDARHHCTAFVICTDNVRTARSSDDGEPAGTAGIPMLTALLKEDVENVTVVVTRYFGGIKLGAGGLTRAYGGAVADGLAAMPRVVREVRPIWEVALPHADAGRIQEDLIREGAVILRVDYSERVSVQLTYNGDVPDLLARTTQGKLVPSLIGEDTIEVPAQ
ncbi:MAG: YigZ family protein [Propionibacteriaceae bacterium]|jgi:uncharacterized YigZ family protein|nr:YigZ family protein [Propionibacteriaceae bacterium]